MTPIDWSKPIETVDGRKCLVLCTDARGSDPVWIRVESSIGEHYFFTARLNGCRYGDAQPFFRNVPEKFERTVWVNVYANTTSGADSRREADYACSSALMDKHRIACIKTTITGHVGQFDD